MTYSYNSQGLPAVGGGLPGLPSRRGHTIPPSGIGGIVIAAEPPPQGEWLPLDGSVWDDRLDATDIPGGAFYDVGSLYTVATGQADAVIGWLPDDRGFFTYQYSSKNLRRYLMGVDGKFALSGSLTLSDMTVTTNPGQSKIAVRQDGLQVAIQTTSGGSQRVYDIGQEFSSASFRIQYTPPATLTIPIVYSAEYHGEEFMYAGQITVTTGGAQVAFVSVFDDWATSNPVLLSPATTGFDTQIQNLLIDKYGKYVYRGYRTATGTSTSICRYERDAAGSYSKLGESNASGFLANSSLFLTYDGGIIVQRATSTPTEQVRAMPAGEKWTGTWSATTTASSPNAYGRVGLTYKSGAVAGESGSAVIKNFGDFRPSFATPTSGVSFSFVSSGGKYAYRSVSGTLYFYKVQRPLWIASDGKQTWARVA